MKPFLKMVYFEIRKKMSHLKKGKPESATKISLKLIRCFGKTRKERTWNRSLTENYRWLRTVFIFLCSKIQSETPII